MGMMKKVTRKIDGDTYHLVGSANPKTKREALKEAKEIREKGYPTVIVKAEGGYRVFSRYTQYKHWRPPKKKMHVRKPVRSYKAKVHAKLPVKSFSRGRKGKVHFNLPQKVVFKRGIRSLAEARRELAQHKSLYGEHWKNFKIYRDGKNYLIAGSKR